MNNNESSDNQDINVKENMLGYVLNLIDKVAKNPEEKILLEDSIKSIIKETDVFVDHIREIDKERRNELLNIYNQILDKLKQKVSSI